ncbi:MAG: lysylphosphatidylglycerol synthase transmembrane domain-containing protein [Bacteroidia bacterium]|nr:lysylphosphatidylglycerol synthase transmembrane domain-containing protein [Bacteroidia bacterium]
MSIYNFFKRNQKYIVAVLLIVVFILIGRFIATINFIELKKYMQETPAMIGGVIFASLIGYISSTIAWWLCFGQERKKTTFIQLFTFKHVGEMLTIFNPTGIIAGDGLKATYIFKKGIDKKEGLSSILLSRALLFLSGIFLLIVSIIYLTIDKISHDKNAVYILIGVIAIGLIATFLSMLGLHKKLYLGKMVEKLKSKKGFSFITDKSIISAYEVNQLLSDFFRYKNGNFIAAFLLSATQWLFGALEFFIVLRMLSVPISFPDAVTIEMGVIFFKTIGAIIPGQIGLEEYGNKVMLATIGVPSNEIWLVVTLMRRTRQLFWLAIAGIFALIISKSK